MYPLALGIGKLLGCGDGVAGDEEGDDDDGDDDDSGDDDKNGDNGVVGDLLAPLYPAGNSTCFLINSFMRERQRGKRKEENISTFHK